MPKVYYLVEDYHHFPPAPRQPQGLECSNPFECLARKPHPIDDQLCPLLHPAILSLMVDYCSMQPDIVSRLARTCKAYSRAFPYSANMICLGDFLAGQDYSNAYDRKQAQSLKEELALQIFRTHQKPCVRGHSWEVTLLSGRARLGHSFLHSGVAHLHPRGLSLWLASEDSRSRGGLGVSLDIFHDIRSVGGLKACVQSHLLVTQNPTPKLACSKLARTFPGITHRHWFCKNHSTLVEKLASLWDESAESLQPFLQQRLALAATVFTSPSIQVQSPAVVAAPGSSSPSETAPARRRPPRDTARPAVDQSTDGPPRWRNRHCQQH